MGRRTLRLRRNRLSAAALEAWRGRYVDVVLTDGTTHHGRLTAADDRALVLDDSNSGLEWNDDRHRHRLPYTEIDEIVISPAAPY